MPSGIRVSYNSRSVLFTDSSSKSLTRIYDGSAELSRSATGSQILGGPAFGQKYIWAISTLLPKDQALELDAMFRDWDQRRSEGGTPAVLVEDDTFGDPISTYAIFSTPPSYILHSGITGIDFGLTEV